MFLLENPYNLEIINKTNVHYGNGAKNELKKEDNKYNFKFYYKIDNTIKFCSVGFDTFKSFYSFVKPINDKYYIFEYVFDNKKCLPYFDYEYEIKDKPSNSELKEQLSKIIKNIKKCFNELLKIELQTKELKITQSHGFKSNEMFKVSFHIVITGYYFESNNECKFLCDWLHEKDKNFDLSVYSKDRLMRTVLSYKDWKDNRKFVAINNKHEEIVLTIDKIRDYLITYIKDEYEKISVPIIIKKKITSKKEYINNNIIKQDNEIGFKLEKIVKEKYHEDAYFIKSVLKDNNMTFYEFNYNDRNKKCFSGHKHDRIGFFCYIDNENNILLKCFSENCKGSKYIIGNMNETILFEKVVDTNVKYITECDKTKEILKQLQTSLKSVVIKSPMGTGKTELIARYINDNKVKKILWISTRQSYANNVFKRLKDLKFVNYLDDKLNFHKEDKIIVQLESLHKLGKESIKMFDLVVLDEIESILYHFSSETMLSQSEGTFNLLYNLCICNITKIIAMDADYNNRGNDFIKSIGSYEIIINNYKNATRIIELTEEFNYFINDIKKSIKKKEKICIIGLSTKLLYQIAELLDKINIKYILHTRDSDDKLKKKLVNVNELWGDYQVVMFSPTISVGVDHTDKYFDKVYSIIVSNCASSRTYLQMLGRIRNMKNDTILSYIPKTMNRSINQILYNHEDMKEYFKYVDTEFDTTKKYIFDEKENMMHIVTTNTTYNTIMMHNKIENLNKVSEYYLTSLNKICNESNYKMIFINKNDEDNGKYIKLNDDIYIKKIIEAKDINTSEFLSIGGKINNNDATENEKFSFQKYRFKKFWNIKEITNDILVNYFRHEIKFNGLLILLDKPVRDNNYMESNTELKAEVINNMINILGFNINNLDIKLDRDIYYKNVKKLLNDSSFEKNYDKIRTLFGRSKEKLNKKLDKSGLSIFLNHFFIEFGLRINCEIKKITVENKRKNKHLYVLSVIDKYKNILESIKNEDKIENLFIEDIQIEMVKNNNEINIYNNPIELDIKD
jgi:hypothetical protein